MARLRFWRRGCPEPPREEYSREELSAVTLPPKEKVLAKLDALVKDKDVHLVIKDILDAIYSLPEDSEFTVWMRTNALRYKIHNKEHAMIDYILAMTLAFVAYCKEKVYGEATLKGLMAAKNTISEPACLVIANLIEELKSAHTGADVSRRELVKLAYKWKKETDKIKKLWYRIEENWCKW